METINLLFSVDDNYVTQLETVLLSIRTHTPTPPIDVYVLQKQALNYNSKLEAFCQKLEMNYFPVVIGDTAFSKAPVTDRWPESIYYRLLAHDYLPEDLSSIIYFDADILVINSILPLTELDMTDYLYAAASHKQLTELTNYVNRIRLNTYDAEGYYNSGILVMNLDNIRQHVKAEDIFTYISENRLKLFLPDQDVLNALYSDRILSIPDEVYNFDARRQLIYELISEGEWTMDWVIDHTIVLHFCGKDKPWHTPFRNQFSALYKHYQRRAKLLSTSNKMWNEK
ncbi:glycosyltransferase family 8 protein [Fundicoccus culcitae]|uniref:Glycosyltransferase family 8 protein n=1 Tax=Fundicoccus culcitae TaxID=2969821 RepID=A0ABY5P6E3_9LACT|nr:glycosyltransferase family 8 protein [Fundicoccus culcitae]UUX34296.1 glycosyltransferase family 8 protein [Fundicoccus culcitae]